MTLPLALLLLACAAPADDPLDGLSAVDFGDRVVEWETRAHATPLDALQILQLIGFEGPVETTTGYTLMQVRYETTSFDGRVVPVSGLMAVPDGDIKGVVSWQHGTNAIRANALSSPGSLEGLAVSAVFAGDGWLVVGADYIGLGVSEEIPPYLHTESTVNAVVDLLSIAGLAAEALGAAPELGLVGFSQGATVSAGVQRRLQVDNPTGLTLRRAAGLAGPYNLRDIALPYAIEQDRSYYLAYVANAYAHIYGQPLSSILQSAYVDVVPALFDGGATFDEIDAALPEAPEDLYTEAMLADIEAGRDNWFTLALEENETWRWVPETEFRLIYGEEDTDVSPADATGAFDHMWAEGGAASLLSVGARDHGGAVQMGLPHVQRWFNDMTEVQ
ncbi:MAG: hypothetical protein H6739_28975 [Alphaproteobacteria bacterium]|nr:hypothetical protein [Alphaproteobacteria bacterium]